MDGFNVTDFGGRGDCVFLNTGSIQEAINQAHSRGGGTVYFPPGKYLSGMISLKDNVTVYLEAGATLYAVVDEKQYNGRHFIHAADAVNVAIRGRGAIDGNGPFWWRKEYGRHGPEGWEPSQAPMDTWRWMPDGWRPRLVHLFRCQNLLIEDITLQNSPSWTCLLTDCNDVNIRGISLINGNT